MQRHLQDIQQQKLQLIIMLENMGDKDPSSNDDER